MRTFFFLFFATALWGSERSLDVISDLREKVIEQMREGGNSDSSPAKEDYYKALQQLQALQEDENFKRPASRAKEKRIYKWRPEIEKRAGFAGLEFLWWTAQVGALDYIIRGQTPSVTLGGIVNQNQLVGAVGTLKSPSYDWEYGLRASIGYRFPRDFWELEALYTYFHSSSQETLGPPSGFDTLVTDTTTNDNSPSKALAGTFYDAPQTPIVRAKSSIHFNYNVGDLILARRLLKTDSIIMRKFISFTGAWLWQNWRFSCVGGPSNKTPGISGNTTTGKENWKFSGGGLRLGLATDWFLGKGLSIDSKVSMAGYLGHYHHHSETFFGNQDLPTLGFNIAPQYAKNVLYNDTRLAFHTQFALLPAWGMMFKNWGIKMYVGYELNLWLNLHEVYKVAAISPLSIDGRELTINRGLLGLHGLTSGVSVVF